MPTALSLRDSGCEVRAGPQSSEAARVQDPHWVREAGCGAGALAKDRPLQELPDGKHFLRARRAGGAQGLPMQPQWTLVSKFS